MVRWRRFDSGRQALMRAELTRVSAAEALSRDDFESPWTRLTTPALGRAERASGLDYNSGRRRSVRTEDPTVSPRSVGSAVRTNVLVDSDVTGLMMKAAPVR